MKQAIYIGFDPREAHAFAVARQSIRRHLIAPVPIRGVVLSQLRDAGLYTRSTSVKDGRLWDDISGAPCATEFSISRFLVPQLAGSGLAVFMDCDVLARANVSRLLDSVDLSKAVSVVKHHFDPPEGVKMDGQLQLRYARKNWSSVAVWNCDSPGTKRLTVDMVNSLPGRDLHAFNWLDDEEIGELDPEWNYLVSHTQNVKSPKIIHFTDGLPSMDGYSDCEYAAEWFEELYQWAS